MLSDCCSRINQASISKEPSPYILQLRRFEDRVNQKFPKLKNTSFLRKSHHVKNNEKKEDYLELVKRMIANSENINIFQDKEEIQQVQTQEDVKNRNIMKNLKLKIQQRKIETSYKRCRKDRRMIRCINTMDQTIDSKRVNSEANTTQMRIKKLKPVENEKYSFINYKKNSRVHVQAKKTRFS